MDYAVDGDVDAADFSGLLNGKIDFAAGQESHSLTLQVVGDTRIEAHESFTVTLSNPSGPSTVVTATASGTIHNDDVLTVSIAADEAVKAEGNSGTTPPRLWSRAAVISRASPRAVDYTISGDVDAADFSGPLSDTINTCRVSRVSPLTLNVIGDSFIEADESFTVTLSNLSGPSTVVTATASGTIQNDDAEVVNTVDECRRVVWMRYLRLRRRSRLRFR
ncbi:MAG: hypothetical protein R3C05_21460 [Pirellulaceae bacterium]